MRKKLNLSRQIDLKADDLSFINPGNIGIPIAYEVLTEDCTKKGDTIASKCIRGLADVTVKKCLTIEATCPQGFTYNIGCKESFCPANFSTRKV